MRSAPLLLLFACAPPESTIPTATATTTEPTTTTVTTDTTTPTTTTTTPPDSGDTGYYYTTTTLPDDADQDGIPDEFDPFPNDDQRPGVAMHETVYAHDSSTLYFMNVLNYNIGTVGGFAFNGVAGQMTDIAIDRYGVLYGCTYTDLFVCHPQTAECWHIGSLSGSYNGLTFVPIGTMDQNVDALVAISGNGDWYRLDGYITQQLTTTLVGGYGPGYLSSGDAFSIDGVGTWAAVNGSGIVIVDPIDGTVGGALPNVGSSIWGLAGWIGEVFAFDSTGRVYSINPAAGTSTQIADTAHGWWGAGVRTWIPPNP